MFSAVGGLGREGWVSVSHIPLGWPGWHPWSPPALLVTGKPDGLQLGPQVGAGVCRSRAERGWSRVLPLLVSAENYSPEGRPPRLGRGIPHPPALASTPPGPGISVRPEL